jgi:hypothetical protein
MKARHLVFVAFTFCSSFLYAQQDSIWSCFQGLRNNGNEYFGARSYQMFAIREKTPYSPKAIEKLARKYGVKSPHRLIDNMIQRTHVYTVDSVSRGGYSGFIKHFFFPDSGSVTLVMALSTTYKEDLNFERYFVNEYLKGSIPPWIYEPLKVDAVNFAGRYLHLGPMCQWMNTLNLQCPNNGQMNWSIHIDSTEARHDLENQFNANQKKWLAKTKELDTVNVFFENIPTKAIRTRVKVNLPKVMTGGSNILIVYYVLQRVRGKYLACVLSHWTNDFMTEHKLPPLLAEVMRLTE